MKNDKIACFFTGGYTEACGYMQVFLSRINDSFFYEQCMPNSVRKKKGTPKKLEDCYNGVTGHALISKVYEFLKKSFIMDRFNKGAYKGILIEDDLDGRFDYLNEEQIESYENDIRKNIADILGKTYPVFFVYASPEAESWFLSDWNNGFGHLFSQSVYFDEYSASERKKFSLNVKKNIEYGLLKKNTVCVESYAHADDGSYRKLSDDIFSLIEKQNIKNHVAFSYSKSLHGSQMLKQIEPDKVRKKCNIYFNRSYLALKNANV